MPVPGVGDAQPQLVMQEKRARRPAAAPATTHLHHLWRRVVRVVVCLVVLVPLIPGVHTVEVLGLARPVLLVPPVHLRLHRHLTTKGPVPLIAAHRPVCLDLELPHGFVVRQARCAAAAEGCAVPELWRCVREVA